MGAPRPAPCATPWGQWHRTPPGPDWRRGGRRSPMPTRVWERETQVVVAGLGVRGQRVLLRPVAPAGPRWDQRRPGRWTQSGPGRPSCPSGWICATGARSRRQPGRSSSECGSVRWARGHPAPRLHLADARPGSGPALPHVQARPRPAPSTWASSEPLSLPGETSRAPPPGGQGPGASPPAGSLSPRHHCPRHGCPWSPAGWAWGPAGSFWKTTPGPADQGRVPSRARRTAPPHLVAQSLWPGPGRWHLPPGGAHTARRGPDGPTVLQS